MENDLYAQDFIPAHRRALTQADLRITMLMAVVAVVLVNLVF